MRVTEEAEDIDTETQNLDREAMAKSDGDGGDGEPLFGEESSDDESRYEKLRHLLANCIHISGYVRIFRKARARFRPAITLRTGW